MIRFIIGALIFFLIYKIVRFVMDAFTTVNKSEANAKVKYRANNQQVINKDDIIEADFEEIKEKTKAGEGK